MTSPSDKARKTHSNLFNSKINGKPRDPKDVEKERRGDSELTEKRRRIEEAQERKANKDDLLADFGW
jgi:hypothetical protein